MRATPGRSEPSATSSSRYASAPAWLSWSRNSWCTHVSQIEGISSLPSTLHPLVLCIDRAGVQAACPPTLEWDVNRIYLTGDFIMREATIAVPSPQASALSLVSQERLGAHATV